MKIEFDHIHSILSQHDLIGVGENTDIAKGLYAIPENWKDTLIQIKRKWLRKR